MLRTKRKLTCTDGVRKLLLAWLGAVTVEYLLLGRLRPLEDLDTLARMCFLRVVLLACGFFACLVVLSRFPRTAAVERWSMAGAFCIVSIAALSASFSWAFLAACLLVMAVLVGYGLIGWDNRPEVSVQPQKGNRLWPWITAALSAAFFLLVCAWTVGRVYSFSTPTFDFGIFSQMFYHMKESGLPVTTVERDGLLSHFAVHVSPIYYLMLPFYCLMPTPATLQVLQAAVVTSAVIPLWLLGKHHGLPSWQRMLTCAVLLLYPAFSGGTSYDIHENCFLTPLLLWLLYGVDRKNIPITAVAALLTLTVKEDAAVYVAVIGLYLAVKGLLRRQGREVLTGICLLAVSVGWFFAVTGYLASNGDGVMTYRYDNFMYDGSSSLITVIKAVLLSPMKAIYECMDSQKLYFIAMTMLPLLGLPLLTRRYERYILLIPYILVNLMPDYRYQHDIFFQYTFGSIACLMYLAVVNLADIQLDWQRAGILLAAVAVSVVCFGTVVVPKAVSYPVRYVQNAEHYRQLRESLQSIPEGASVTATTFYTTFLSQRQVLYDVRYSSKAHMLETEYVVLDPSAKNDYQKYGEEKGYENLTQLLEQNGYQAVTQWEDALVIYRRG